jgi:hypothetical protein
MPSADGGDLLSVVGANAGPNKLDAYLHRTIQYEANVDPASGALTATVHVNLRNDTPKNAVDYVAGNGQGLPFGTNRHLLSVYTPHLLSGAVTVDGVDVASESYDELGLHRHAVFVNVPPGGSASVVFHLSGVIDLHAGYRLELVTQPTAIPDEVEADVDGLAGPRRVFAGRLSVDKTIYRSTH